MKQYWIFVLLPYSDFNRGDIRQALLKVKRTFRWPIGRYTVNRLRISKGDNILFYIAGDEGKKIVGSAALSTGLVVCEGEFNDYVGLEDVILWRKPLPIKGLVESLSFIKHKDHWGLNFQGGLIRIPESDFTLIINRAELLNRKRSLDIQKQA